MNSFIYVYNSGHIISGAITVIVAFFFLRLPQKKTVNLSEAIRKLDYLGVAVLVGAIVAILLPLNWGGSQYGKFILFFSPGSSYFAMKFLSVRHSNPLFRIAWNSPVVISLLVVGVVLVAAFVLVEKYFAIEPLVPGEIRSFTTKLKTTCSLASPS